MKVLVLGSGLVGRPMAVDLAKDKAFQVTVVDFNRINLDKLPAEFPLQKIEMDITNHKELGALLKDFDIVLNAVPALWDLLLLKKLLKQVRMLLILLSFQKIHLILMNLQRNIMLLL